MALISRLAAKQKGVVGTRLASGGVHNPFFLFSPSAATRNGVKQMIRSTEA